jgi:hypothetical protein
MCPINFSGRRPRLHECAYSATLMQECKNPRETKFCTVVPHICGSSVWNLLRVTLQAPRILRRLPDFWKICTPLLDIMCFMTIWFLVALHENFCCTCEAARFSETSVTVYQSTPHDIPEYLTLQSAVSKFGR